MILGMQHVSTGTAYGALGNLKFYEGNFKAAEQFLERAWGIKEQKLSSLHLRNSSII